jgi:hypothetical protein
MSRNGSGTYSLPAGNPVVTGTTITSTWANNTLTDIASALTDSVAADGQTPMTGDLDLNNNKIVNLEDPVDAQDAATKAYVTSVIPDTANFLLKASNLSDVANVTTSRTNLSAAKSGANSDITSITGLTTALTVAQGGTGSTTLTANNVLLGNGTSAIQAVAPSTNGNILTSNGTTWQSSPPPAVGAAGQLFTSNGTFTIPTSVTAVKVTIGGGGGGGGGGVAGADTGGSGGGGGGFSIGYLTGLTPGNTISVTVGAAGTATTFTGGTGGTSTFSTLTATGGTGGTNFGSGGAVGVGGSGTGGTFNYSGANGGAASSSGPGGTGGTNNSLGIPVFTWGVGGAPNTSGSGFAGTGFSVGGGGGNGNGVGFNPVGGVGRAGFVLVEW